MLNERLVLLERNREVMGLRIGDQTYPQCFRITPSDDGYWFVSLYDFTLDQEDYTIRPISTKGVDILAQARIPNLDQFKYVVRPCEPLRSDYYTHPNPIIPRKRAYSVYFIQGEMGGPVKIGVSENPYARLESFQCGSPAVLNIVRLIEDVPKRVERDLHSALHRYRLHGEWFEPEILINKACQQGIQRIVAKARSK